LQQARSATAQTEALLPLLRAGAQQSVHALAVLTGQPPAALNALLQPAAPQPSPQAGLALALPADTLRQRPDVRVAEQQVRAASARLAQADAARLPSFNLGGSLGLQALTLGALGGGPLLASALASGAWPVWDGGAARAQVNAQDAALAQARSQYRGTVLAALQEVEDALVALSSDRARGDSLTAAAAAAEAAATLANQRFRSGLVDFQTVLETQRSQLATQDALTSVRADIGSDHVRLFKALGGGWRPGMAGPDGVASPLSIQSGNAGMALRQLATVQVP
ncbi:RND transporter, partial [Pelomonas sp. HMWF004]